MEHSVLSGLVASAFVVARDRGGRRREERVEAFFHDRVAFARRFLQAVPIQLLNYVVFADWMNGYGLILIIDHGNGYMTRYAHNSEFVAQVGMRVHAGQVIGLSLRPRRA